MSLPQNTRRAVVVGILFLLVVGLAITKMRMQASRRTADAAKTSAEQAAPSAKVSTEATADDSLPFDVYSGYFVRNTFEPSQPSSFVVIRDEKDFDRIFGVAMVMGDKSHRLAKDVFRDHIVLAAIQRGDAVCEFKVEKVTSDDGVVRLRYATTSTKSDSASFACPLIVSIPRGKYQAVEFVNDRELAKRLPYGYN